MATTAARSRVLGMVLVVILAVGGIAYYTYTVSSQLQQENARLNSQISRLQANISSLQGELDTISALRQGYPSIVLRTWGTALASYGERKDGLTYLRLTETDANSGVEAALASKSFNATIPGNSVSWSAVANHIATDKYHTIWPMVLENSPGGTNAIEFEMKGGVQEVAVITNGVKGFALVSWNSTAPHTFKIVIVVPGQQVDFYIDGKLVKTMTTNIPKVDFLLNAAEIKADSPSAAGVATLDVYGGLLSNP
ncbi:MAG: hypothetical protein OK452_02105 [Thaumarchaeota archaeon]|nr:hypothetical protein [Nitrososphaerota archaeon]